MMSPERTPFDDVVLSKDELKRYSRHLIMPEVGMAGQRKLKAASVLLVGAGGLGSPLALYLGASGIGRIGLVDHDVVDQSNLQRQVIHSTHDVGRSKLASAKERIEAINPHVQVETYDTQLSSQNALQILEPYDIVVDGTDNFPTRYLVNDACVLLKKINVYGSIFRFEGQVSVFDAQKGPCYRCLYPEPPPPGLVPSCAEGGVLGVLPGIIGTLQAQEALKLILGIGDSLVGRLILFDGLRMSFRELTLKKDYEIFCGLPQPGEAPSGNAHEITVDELKRRQERREDIFLLDVREPFEYEIVNLQGHLIPLGELPNRIHELNLSSEIVVHCHHGTRSGRAVEFLKSHGFKKVKNLVGGIDTWASQIDPLMTRY
jgi:sulfur-carrier protein adenylyltransferase/sulfurtransferase